MSRDDLRWRVAALPWAQPADDNPAEPAVGEIWRASWGETHLLVLITAIIEPTIRAAVVTGDDVGDENTVVLPAEQSALPGVPALVWFGVAGDLPLRVLDRRLGRAAAGYLDQRRTSPFPPVTSPLDNRAVVRADLEDRLDFLAHAEWQEEAEGPGLRELTGVLPGQFAQRVEMLPGDAVQVYERTRPLNDVLIERTAVAFGLPADEVVAATTPRIPADVIVLFDDPRRIRSVRRRATELGSTEVDVMREIASGVLATAARTTGHAQPDWGALIDDALGD